MQLTVSDEEILQEWIKEKGKTTLTISNLQVEHGCCVPPEGVLKKFAKPQQLENYSCAKVDSLAVYIEKGLSFKNERVHLELSGICLKTIRVLGLQRFLRYE